MAQMTSIQDVLKWTLKNGNLENLDTKIEFRCKTCDAINYDLETNKVIQCKCIEIDKYKTIFEKSGIRDADKTFEAFEIDGKQPVIVYAKGIAQSYLEKFEDIRSTTKNSLVMLGNPGSGKTHLCIAVALELLKKGIGVLYMPYREVVTALKQNITDEEYYQREIMRYKAAPVLYIDDLFKGNITKSDLNIAFEIINYRYIKKLPIIVSSEFMTDGLINFDEAIGSRIVEMGKDYLVEIYGKGLNHRLAV